MQFDYEIPVDEYVAAQALYYEAQAKGRVIKRALGWFLLSLLVIICIVELRSAGNWGSIWRLLTVAWFIYATVANLFPKRQFRGSYLESGLAGKRYHGELNENGFSVSGDSCRWQVLWADVRHKGEDKRVFMFTAKGTIFIFGKRYLTDEQQQDIRHFSAMT
jgi:hypothetical protein